MSEAGIEDNTQDGFELGGSLSHLLHRAQQLAANESAEKLREAGVTLRQFSVLAAVSQETGSSQSRLVDMTGIDRSTLADMLNRMQRAGLISRAVSEEDARAKSVALTEKGQKALAAAAPAVRGADSALIATLAKNRRAGFVDLLTTLIDAKTDRDPAVKVSEPEIEGVKDKGEKKKSKSKAKTSGKSKGKGKDKDKKKSKKKAKA
ncbi:MAG: MarR family winged helix-turn-helix transcriptional regulator [Pseudomonadota bacterium]